MISDHGMALRGVRRHPTRHGALGPARRGAVVEIGEGVFPKAGRRGRCVGVDGEREVGLPTQPCRRDRDLTMVEVAARGTFKTVGVMVRVGYTRR